MAFIPNMDQALEDVSELLSYGREMRDIGNSFSHLIDVGTPLLRIDEDQTVATGTGDFEVFYQLSEGMMAVLTAARRLALDGKKH